MARLASTLILSTGIALSGLFVGLGFLSAKNPLHFVEVKGLAEEVVKSNEAIWTLNIKLVNNDLNALYESISKAQQSTRDFLIRQGFKESELTMNPVSVMDNQSVNYNNNQDIPRYSVDTGITVSSAHVDLVAQAIQKTGELVAQGVVVTSSNATYRFTQLNDIKPKMLEAATQSARIAAESFAKDSRTSLGNIRHASQGLFTITDANSSFDSGNSILKKVRIVTTVEYQLN
jgi:hypothetical protein